MAYSTQRAVSDGTMTLLPVSIEYFDREEISVLFDGVLNARQWAWVGTTDRTLSFTPAVDDTVEVMIVRSTDLSELRHQFSLGAQFTAESLDESLLQVLHIAQEATERQLGGDFFDAIDMHGSQITNLGAATAPNHAVTLAQYQADASGASAAKDTAVASASTAVAASNSASTSAGAALLSANNADISESNALSSANSAAVSASTASTKATEAAASAEAALVSENAAELAESNAKASEVAAAASAAAAIHPWEAEAGGIHYDSGNVGIGGSPGTEKLRVTNPSPSTSIIVAGHDGTQAAQDIYINRASSNTGVLQGPNIYFDDSGSNTQRAIQNGQGNLQVFQYRGVWAEDLRIDTTGAVLAKSATGGLGYGTGAGGTVTQATSKSTTVTLNKPTGMIITAAVALGAGVTATFTVNNTLMAFTDIVHLNVTNGNYSGRVYNNSNGSFDIALKNETGVSLSDAVAINFAIIKGATS